jgi:hypothetical protein
MRMNADSAPRGGVNLGAFENTCCRTGMLCSFQGGSEQVILNVSHPSSL